MEVGQYYVCLTPSPPFWNDIFFAATVCTLKTFYALGQHSLIYLILSNTLKGLPWWLSGKESAYQCRRYGFDPLSRKLPHAEKQLSQRAATTEPVL